MIQEFDKFGLYEQKVFVLCNPDRSELFSLGTIYNRKYKPRYNGLGEISFTAPAEIDGVVTDYYDSLLYRKLVYIVDLGYFMIVSVSETSDGIKKEKEIVANSLEVELTLKRLVAFKGTYKFFDYVTPSTTLLGIILTYLPGWTIGVVDSALTTLYRTFAVSDSTIYNFLMGEVEDAYQCIFVFDSIAKTISAHTMATAITPTDIFLSYDNLLENVDIKEITEELITALSVHGKGDLSINQVNPTGNDTVYNFQYYKTLAWMSQDLIDAITVWEGRVLSSQQPYADILTLLRSNNETLITLTGQMVDLVTDMTSLEGVKGARIQQGIAYSDINTQIAAKQVEINSKQAEIDSVNAIIGVAVAGVYPDGSLMEQLTTINTYCSFASNFTTQQQAQLSNFIIGNTYNNENFIQTDLMTQPEIQDQAQALYDQAIGVLAKTSMPRYEFSVNAVNFVFLKEFQLFIDQLVLGASVTLELKEDTYIYPVLLGIDLDYDNPSDFSLIFGNRLRLDDSSYIFSDLFGQTVRQGINTSFNSEQWGSWNNNYRDDVSTFITSALDASKNAVISGSMQDIIVNQNGIRGRSSIGGGLYSPEQVWIINNTLAFTKDNWNTASVALGKVQTSSGSSWGLVAETIVGRLLAGNQLTITNQNNTFTVDGSGATLTNATLAVTTTNGNSKILLDPTNGIKIQGKVAGVWTDKLYADSLGNLTFKGALSGATGTFSGTLSAASISGGTITGAAINGGTISGTTGTFSGNVSAANLVGLVTSDQINSLIASKIGAGTMSNVNLAGSRGTISVGNANNLAITSSNGMVIQDTGIGITMLGNVYVNNQYLDVAGINSNISALFNTVNQLSNWRNSGLSGQIDVFSSSYRYLGFTNGLFTSYHS